MTCCLTHSYGGALKAAVVSAAMAAPQLRDRAASRIVMLPVVQPVTESRTGEDGKAVTKTFAVVTLAMHMCPLSPTA